jgi:phosphoribosylglycinamide formyltransferase-1
MSRPPTATSSQLGVLASGTGTLLTAIVDAGLPVAVVVVDRPCAAEKLAADAGLAVERIERLSFGSGFDRVAYTHRVVEALDRHGVGTVAMAGFGTVLSAALFDGFPGRVLNTHPALLPSFKGWHAVREALAFGVKVTGCTVHIATETVDEGPILAQQAVAVEPGDTEALLHERIKAVERTLYPETIRRFLEGAPL